MNGKDAMLTNSCSNFWLVLVQPSYTLLGFYACSHVHKKASPCRNEGGSL